MSKVGISLAYRGGEDVPALRSDGRGATAITSSGTSQQASITAAADEYWMISTDGTIWVAFGADPTASAGTTFMLTAGTYYFQAMTVGEKCAVIDA